MLTVDFAKIPFKAGMRVLDAGCGSGRHVCESYRIQGIDVAGVDLNLNDLFKAKGYLALMAQEQEGLWLLAQADLTRLPLRRAASMWLSVPRFWSISRTAGVLYRNWCEFSNPGEI